MELTLNQIGDAVAQQVAAIMEAKAKEKDNDTTPEPKADESTMGNLTLENISKAVEMGQIDVAALEQEFATMNKGFAGIAGQLDKSVKGVPIGSALVGGGLALIVSDVIDGFVNPVGDDGGYNMINGAAKLATVFVTTKFARGFIGGTGATVYGALIAFSVLRDFLPIDEWVGKITGAFSSAPAGNRFAQPGARVALNPGGDIGMSNVIPAHHGISSQFDRMFG
jgi:hypothetical protein